MTMNRRDDELSRQVERALSELRLAKGSEVEARVDDDGTLSVIGMFHSSDELEAAINAIVDVTGVGQVTCMVGVIEPPPEPVVWHGQWPAN
jgi:hypothetical protein